jgi:diguanylate cyclase (GGDEF)-like protein/PAS domain S-box-containing protein
MDSRHSVDRAETDGLWEWNLESNRIHFSPRWISQTGCQDHEVGNTPRDWFERVHPDDREQLRRDVEAVRLDGSSEFSVRYRLRHKDGTYRWMSCRAVVTRNESRQAIRLQGSQSDVTADRVTDPLTGLPNRLLLLDRLIQSIDRARRYQGHHYALLLLELGRPADPANVSVLASGDPTLVAAARRLELSLPRPGTSSRSRHKHLVARMQGHQFAVLLDGLSEVSHTKLEAERILREILTPFPLGGGEVRLAASIGIAVSATGYQRADDVVRDAATALYRAQVLGGSRCEIFDTAILQTAEAERQLEADFEKALERQEFELRYQPIVSLATDRVAGFEALVRWRHPVLGMILPLDFIPIAERTGFIVPLGRWILLEACGQVEEWRNLLPPATDLWISVNCSAAQLLSPTFIDEVDEVLRTTNLEPGTLTLELTEAVAMENPTATKAALMRLRALGVRISIDDFGTGYSSLAYLRQFPIDVLKIDQSFIRGIEVHNDMADIVVSLTTMAQQLGLFVVAEGIENGDQLALLRLLHCDAAQGYFFAKPLDVEKATHLVQTGQLSWPHSPGHTALSVGGSGRWRRAFSRSLARHRWPLIAATVCVLLTAGLITFPLPYSSKHSLGIWGGRASMATAPIVPAEQPLAQETVQRRLPVATSFRVLHQHRIGSCRGHLAVSARGITFVPEEKTSPDGFAFAYQDFLYAVAESRLTIRSHTGTYRFKAIVDGKRKAEAVLHEIVDAMGAFRAAESDSATKAAH